MNTIKYTLVAIMATMLFIEARGIEFSFDDPKKVNSMSIYLDSELEPFSGTASGISGSIDFDPANVAATTGKIVVDAPSIQMTNAKMTEVLHSPDWIDVQNNRTVEFDIRQVVATEKKADHRYDVVLRGRFTLNGRSKEMEVPATLSYLPGKLKARNGKDDGDLLIVRTEFGIDRVEFGIKPDVGVDKVGNKIQVQAGIVGFAAHAK